MADTLSALAHRASRCTVVFARGAGRPVFLNFSKDLGMRSRLLQAILPWLALLLCWPAWADSPAQALVQADAGARAELIERWAAEGNPA